MTVGALFFGGNPEEDETRTYDSDEERSAGRVGGSYSSWWQLRCQRSRLGNGTRKAIGNCGERKQLVLFSERRQSRNRGETLESSSAHRWNSFRIHDGRVSFHGSSNRRILVALFITRQPRENVEPAEEEDDGTREAKRNQAAGTNNSRAQKQGLPRKRSKAS